MYSLKNKNIIVTGGGSGIGQAICSVLAKAGGVIHIFDRNFESANQTAEQINATNGSSYPYECDVTLLDQVKALIQEIDRDHPLDILINNAGIAHVGNAVNTSPEDFDRLMKVNVAGYYHMIHSVIPYFVNRKSGVIINMASVAGSVGVSDRFAYCTTKGAVIAMTYSVAKDFVKDGIRCNCISPGRVHTPFVDGFIAKNYAGREKEMFEKLSMTQPIGRMAEPIEIAHLALYLCSDEAAFVTGTDFPIDGGYIRLNS